MSNTETNTKSVNETNFLEKISEDYSEAKISL